MSWAELNISMPPSVGDPNAFDAWMQQLVEHLRNYLGSYHDRGDPSAVDFDKDDLTKDTAWYDLDLSSIIPEDTKAVDLIVEIKSNAANDTVQFRKNGNSNTICKFHTNTQVANVRNIQFGTVACDSSRKIEYWVTASTWETINITVTGWYK